MPAWTADWEGARPNHPISLSRLSASPPYKANAKIPTNFGPLFVSIYGCDRSRNMLCFAKGVFRPTLDRQQTERCCRARGKPFGRTLHEKIAHCGGGSGDGHWQPNL